MKYNDIKNPNELLKYMQENINYGFISKTGKIYDNPNSDNWQNDWYLNCIIQDGESLLETKYGTCFDQVELERKWFNDNNFEFKTIFIWFEMNKPNNFPTHTFLMYKSNNKWYWFEHAFYDNQGIHQFNTEKELIDYVKKQQLDYVIKNKIGTKDDYKYLKEYEYVKPNKNSKVNEYIKDIVI